MPVLPEVGSTIVVLGPISPACSPASIIARPIRSFTLPPGLKYSSLASRWHGRSRPIRSRRTIGVPPIRSITESTTSIRGPGSVIRCTSTPATGATGRSLNKTVGSPAWCTCDAIERLASISPVTPTSRGMWTRSSPMREGDGTPVGMRTTRPARATRMCGAGSGPITKRTSTRGVGTRSATRPRRVGRRGSDGVTNRRESDGAKSRRSSSLIAVPGPHSLDSTEGRRTEGRRRSPTPASSRYYSGRELARPAHHH